MGSVQETPCEDPAADQTSGHVGARAVSAGPGLQREPLLHAGVPRGAGASGRTWFAPSLYSDQSLLPARRALLLLRAFARLLAVADLLVTSRAEYHGGDEQDRAEGQATAGLIVFCVVLTALAPFSAYTQSRAGA
jgi:hypothetical protein